FYPSEGRLARAAASCEAAHDLHSAPGRHAAITHMYVSVLDGSFLKMQRNAAVQRGIARRGWRDAPRDCMTSRAVNSSSQTLYIVRRAFCCGIISSILAETIS